MKGRIELKALLKTLKAGDIVIIFLLILISFFPLGIFLWQQAQISGEHMIAVISLENEVLHEITLTDHEGVDTHAISTHDHEQNTVEISDGRIRIKSATCTDQVCVRTGYIQRAGQTIICLPHQLVIEIQNIGENSLDDGEIDIISS